MVGCGDAPEPTYDEDFYKSHDSERMAKLEWCKGNAERKETFNCRNAHSAQAQKDIDTMLGDGFKRPE